LASDIFLPYPAGVNDWLFLGSDQDRPHKNPVLLSGQRRQARARRLFPLVKALSEFLVFNLRSRLLPLVALRVPDNVQLMACHDSKLDSSLVRCAPDTFLYQFRSGRNSEIKRVE
jgi:hypothetical protein